MKHILSIFIIILLLSSCHSRSRDRYEQQAQLRVTPTYKINVNDGYYFYTNEYEVDSVWITFTSTWGGTSAVNTYRIPIHSISYIKNQHE